MSSRCFTEPSLQPRIVKGWFWSGSGSTVPPTDRAPPGWAANPWGNTGIFTQVQSGDLSLVQISRDTVLSLVEIMMLLCQLSYAIKTQLKAPKAPYPYKGHFLSFAVSLWFKADFHVWKEVIIGKRPTSPVEHSVPAVSLFPILSSCLF